MALSMLLMLKKYLLDAYGLLPQRVALFAVGNAERRKAVRCPTIFRLSAAVVLSVDFSVLNACRRHPNDIESVERTEYNTTKFVWRPRRRR